MKRLLSVISAVVLLLSAVVFAKAENAEVNDETYYSKMLERAEAVVNYEWTPSQRIYTWNENEYNGKLYFEAGETVRGVPYTLFSWELGFDGLLSLEQYKEKAPLNYSASAYCTSVPADRIGPAYGTCCATFVSEVFSGNFMNGLNPLYDGVGGIERSEFSTCYKNVKVSSLQPGDALSNEAGTHIVWVAEVTDEYVKLYEATPPVSTVTILDRNSHIDSSGYLVYGGKRYSIVSKSNQIVRDDLAVGFSIDTSVPQPVKAYSLSSDKTPVYDSVDGNVKTNKIYSTDECFIDAVFDNGWCHVNYPLDAGGLDSGYVKTSVFFSSGSETKTVTPKRSVGVYSRSDLSENAGYSPALKECECTGETDSAYQIIYPLSTGGYRLGWVSKDELSKEIEYHPINSMCPFKSYPITSDKFVCYNADLVTSPGKIYTTDYCTIEEIYSDGWCRVSCPWSDGTTKTVYTDISNFVSDPDGELQTYNSDKYINLYKYSSLTEQFLRIYPGDKCKVVYSSDTAVQIFMPMSGKDYNVLGWASADDIKLDTPNITYGDVTGDGVVNGKDVVRLRKYLLTYDETTGVSDTEIFPGADVNGDGAVNGKDLVRLRKYLLYFDEATGLSSITLGPG